MESLKMSREGSDVIDTKGLGLGLGLGCITACFCIMIRMYQVQDTKLKLPQSMDVRVLSVMDMPPIGIPTLALSSHEIRCE